MDKNLLVEIFVPTKSDTNSGVTGTGYPVAKNLILTARHVLHPENRDETKPVEVSWHHRLGKDRDWRKDTRIVWESEDRFDAALIECPFPDDIGSIGLISEERPQSNKVWESEGFPKAGIKDRDTTAVAIGGKVYQAADRENRFQLGVDYAPENQELWRGASGSPVFVDSKLIGVIATCLGNFDGRKLSATPIWKLLEEDAEFCKLLGYDERKKQLTALTKEVVSRLSRSTNAVDLLRREIPGERLAKVPNSPEGLATALMSLPIDQFLMNALKAQDACETVEAADGICKVVEAVLPVIIGTTAFSISERIRGNRSNPEIAVFELPTGLATVAEIIMAAVDARPANFLHPSIDDRFPKGRLNISLPPEGGMDSDNSLFNKAWDQHLINNLAKGEERRQFDEEELLEWVARELAYQAEARGKTRYVVLSFGRNADDIEIKNIQLRFQQIKARYPAIVFVYLIHDKRRMIEMTEYRPLCDIVIRSISDSEQNT